MITRKTTLILGAGASFPYGFPLGETLKNNIVNQILYPQSVQRFDLPKLLINLGHKKEKIQDFALKLKKSNYMSVDAFLEEWEEYVPVGKIAIAANLIDKEMEDHLINENDKGRWYHYLLNLLGGREDFLSNQLSVVTFNYDRSFEYFLYYTLKARFNLPEIKIIEYTKSIPVIHVHGQLGLPLFEDSEGRDYQNTLNEDVLSRYANQINIIHENLHNTGAFQNARRIIKDSDLLVFIGFGFHRKNIERLMLKENFKGEKIFCTFYAKAEGEIARDMIVLSQNTPPPPNQIPIDSYLGDALSFLRDKNELR